MEITEVRIKLMEDQQERLQAFCSITFDHCFVIRDLKIIEGTKGSFVAMPSRKLTDRCPRCSTKNHLRALFCNQCGARLSEDRAGKDADGRAKLYADIAHPINSKCRELIQNKVMIAFRDELVRSQQPGYVCTYDDYGEDAFADLSEFEMPLETRPAAAATVHRVEAGNGAVNPPHISPAGEPRFAQRVAAGRSRGPEIDDEFGEGLG
ncbi:MAG: SpoVG family protein [Planctomycetaceae bacterium]